MTEASLVTEKIAVKPAQYLKVATPAPDGTGASAARDAHLGVRSIEPDGTTSDGLVQAAQTVFRVLTARIAHHESEARKLREALAPFAAATRQNVAVPAVSHDVLTEALLDFAAKHKGD